VFVLYFSRKFDLVQGDQMVLLKNAQFSLKMPENGTQSSFYQGLLPYFIAFGNLKRVTLHLTKL